jgi:hypothetical protein
MLFLLIGHALAGACLGLCIRASALVPVGVLVLGEAAALLALGGLSLAGALVWAAAFVVVFELVFQIASGISPLLRPGRAQPPLDWRALLEG